MRVGDLCEEAFVDSLFEDDPTIRRVVHMAARAGVRPSIENPFIYIQSNVTATTRLLEAARRIGRSGSDSEGPAGDDEQRQRCLSFVYASSSSVYGESESELFSEEDAVDFPVSPYAATKKTCELNAFTYHHLYQLPVTGLRFFTVYGPRGRPDMAPFKYFDRVARGATIQQFGDGTGWLWAESRSRERDRGGARGASG